MLGSGDYQCQFGLSLDGIATRPRFTRTKKPDDPVKRHWLVTTAHHLRLVKGDAPPGHRQQRRNGDAVLFGAPQPPLPLHGVSVAVRWVRIVDLQLQDLREVDEAIMGVVDGGLRRILKGSKMLVVACPRRFTRSEWST